MPSPPEGEDRHIWSLNRLNRRLDLLRCEPRDVEKCLSYLDNADSELHRVLGFYADVEEVKVLYGLKHYIADIYNRDGLDAFRYVVIENYPHFVPPAGGELIWAFFRQFRRDAATGRIVQDEYRA